MVPPEISTTPPTGLDRGPQSTESNGKTLVVGPAGMGKVSSVCFYLVIRAVT